MKMARLALLVMLGVGFEASIHAAEVLEAQTKDGTIITWHQTDSKFDDSLVELRDKNGTTRKYIGTAPVINGYILLGSSDSSIGTKPLQGRYKSYKNDGLVCALNCKGFEKGLIFRLKKPG